MFEERCHQTVQGSQLKFPPLPNLGLENFILSSFSMYINMRVCVFEICLHWSVRKKSRDRLVVRPSWIQKS